MTDVVCVCNAHQRRRRPWLQHRGIPYKSPTHRGKLTSSDTVTCLIRLCRRGYISFQKISGQENKKDVCRNKNWWKYFFQKNYTVMNKEAHNCKAQNLFTHISKFFEKICIFNEKKKNRLYMVIWWNIFLHFGHLLLN